MDHHIRFVENQGNTWTVCNCDWESTAHPNDPDGREAARLESCRHLARVLRFGAVTISGDEYLVPRQPGMGCGQGSDGAPCSPAYLCPACIALLQAQA